MPQFSLHVVQSAKGSLLQVVQKYCLFLFSLTGHLCDQYGFGGAQTHLDAAQIQFGPMYMHNTGPNCVWAASIFGGKRGTGSRADMEKREKGAGSTFVLRTLC